MSTKKSKSNSNNKTAKKEIAPINDTRDEVNGNTTPTELEPTAEKVSPNRTDGKSAPTPSKVTNPTQTDSRDSNRVQEKFFVLGSLDRALDEVDKLLAKGSTDILLDFSGCPFITVDGLEWLEELLLRAESMQSHVRFVNIFPSVYKTFKVSRIDSILRACGAPGTMRGPIC